MRRGGIDNRQHRANLAVAFWSASSGVAALFDALNVVYQEREKRSLVRFYATIFLFTFGFIGFTLAAFAAMIVLPVVMNLFGLGAWSEQLLSIARWPLLLGMVGLGLALLYRYGLSGRSPQWRWVSWGSGLAAVLWIATSMLFSFYVASFESYNRVYGSLGAGVGFMTWIWLSVVVVLLGANSTRRWSIRPHATQRKVRRPRRRSVRAKPSWLTPSAKRPRGMSVCRSRLMCCCASDDFG